MRPSRFSRIPRSTSSSWNHAPSPTKTWEYLFYVDFELDAADPRHSRALAQLKDKTEFFKYLGTYRMAPQTVFLNVRVTGLSYPPV